MRRLLSTLCLALLAMPTLAQDAIEEFRSDLTFLFVWDDGAEGFRVSYGGSARFALQDWEAAAFGLDPQGMTALSRFANGPIAPILTAYAPRRYLLIGEPRYSNAPDAFGRHWRNGKGNGPLNGVHVDITLAPPKFHRPPGPVIRTRSVVREMIGNPGETSRRVRADMSEAIRPDAAASASAARVLIYDPPTVPGAGLDVLEQTTPGVRLRVRIAGTWVTDDGSSLYTFSNFIPVPLPEPTPVEITLAPLELASASYIHERIEQTVYVTIEKRLSGYVLNAVDPGPGRDNVILMDEVNALRRAALDGQTLNGEGAFPPLDPDTYPEVIRETIAVHLRAERLVDGQLDHFCAFGPPTPLPRPGDPPPPPQNVESMAYGACEGRLVHRLSPTPSAMLLRKGEAAMR